MWWIPLVIVTAYISYFASWMYLSVGLQAFRNLKYHPFVKYNWQLLVLRVLLFTGAPIFAFYHLIKWGAKEV